MKKTNNDKATMWLGTYNNIDLTVAADYLEKWHSQHKAVFATGQVEKGKVDGTIHLQYFVQFPNG